MKFLFRKYLCYFTTFRTNFHNTALLPTTDSTFKLWCLQNYFRSYFRLCNFYVLNNIAVKFNGIFFSLNTTYILFLDIFQQLIHARLFNVYFQISNRIRGFGQSNPAEWQLRTTWLASKTGKFAVSNVTFLFRLNIRSYINTDFRCKHHKPDCNKIVCELKINKEGRSK